MDRGNENIPKTFKALSVIKLFLLCSVLGTYKPTMKCFDVQQLAMKFERCFDSEIVNFLSLAEDYTKVLRDGTLL